MGGQHGYFGLWLDYNFGHGHSRARPRCTTYGSPQLSADEDFKLDTLEVWGVGKLPEEQEGVCNNILCFLFDSYKDKSNHAKCFVFRMRRRKAF